MTERNIFELASRQAIRFASDRGDLTTEQLWTLPLQSKNGFDLDSLAKRVNKELKETAEDSFVETSANPAEAVLTLRLDVLKHIIGVKKAEAEALRSAADRAAERRRLVEALANKKDAELASLSAAELQKQIDALG